MGPVFELERVRVLQGQTEVEVVYGVTSLVRSQSDAWDLLRRTRGHWKIEKGTIYSDVHGWVGTS